MLNQPGDDSSTPNLLNETGKSLADAAKSTLLWTLIGAGAGAIPCGIAGAWLFGWTGLWVGLLVGGAIGTLVTWWLMSEV